jgi:hypothetical protein
MSIWKQKAEQRAAEEAAWIAAEEAAWEAKLAAEAAAKAAAEAAKTPEQKAVEEEEERWRRHYNVTCSATEEWSRSPRFYEAQEHVRKSRALWLAEEKRIREGGHPKVNLSKDFPSLGK